MDDDSANVSLVTNASTKKSSKSGPTTPPHAAQVGLSSQNPGADDALSQQVVVPTGQSALSFWYKPQCGSAKTGDQLKVSSVRRPCSRCARARRTG